MIRLMGSHRFFLRYRHLLMTMFVCFLLFANCGGVSVQNVEPGIELSEIPNPEKTLLVNLSTTTFGGKFVAHEYKIKYPFKVVEESAFDRVSESSVFNDAKKKEEDQLRERVEKAINKLDGYDLSIIYRKRRKNENGDHQTVVSQLPKTGHNPQEDKMRDWPMFLQIDNNINYLILYNVLVNLDTKEFKDIGYKRTGDRLALSSDGRFIGHVKERMFRPDQLEIYDIAYDKVIVAREMNFRGFTHLSWSPDSSVLAAFVETKWPCTSFDRVITDCSVTYLELFDTHARVLFSKKLRGLSIQGNAEMIWVDEHKTEKLSD